MILMESCWICLKSQCKKWKATKKLDRKKKLVSMFIFHIEMYNMIHEMLLSLSSSWSSLLLFGLYIIFFLLSLFVQLRYTLSIKSIVINLFSSLFLSGFSVSFFILIIFLIIFIIPWILGQFIYSFFLSIYLW